MKQFHQTDDLDSTTIECPCGSAHTSRGWPDGHDEWLAKHRPHVETDVVTTHISDDGMRCLGANHPRDGSYTLATPNRSKEP